MSIIDRCTDLVKEQFRKSDNKLISRMCITGEHLQLPYHYTPMVQVVADVMNWTVSLGSDFDTVVAIPRSGMIVGSIIATTFGKPLADPYTFANGRRWITKHALRHRADVDFYKSILLVDDGLGEGTQMQKSEAMIRELIPDIKIIKAVLYCTSENRELVDRYYKEISLNEYNQYQYNILHASSKSLACDMDGVLCEEYPVYPTEEEYIDWMKTVKPYKIPIYEIDCIITARPEKYRDITENWLKNHNVRYKRLYMIKGSEDIASFKTSILLKEKPYTYWESDPGLSRSIAKKTGIPTLCIRTGELYG